MKKLTLFTACLLLSALTLVAQEKEGKFKEMNIDMPDETQETDIVDKNEWQLEAAYLHNIYKSGKRSSIGQALIRYGVSKHLELRLLVENGRALEQYIVNTVQSTYPYALSAKVVVLKDVHNLPDVSVVGYLQLPIQQKKISQHAYWSPIVLLALQNEFGEKWKLEYNAGAQQGAYDQEWSWLGNASIHYKIVQRLEVFAEYFAQYQQGEDPQHNAGGGIAYQLNNSIEFFAMAGGTVNSEPANHYFNGGLAFRIPH